MKVSWSSFKTFYAARKVDMLMVEDSSYYYLFLDDPITNLKCEIDKNISDTTDLDEFEDDYKSLCNPEKLNKTNPASPVNEHCMEPWGCEKGYFKSKNDATDGDYVCAITISNRSSDGLTFNYNSDCPIVPAVGNYVFQRETSRRSWITEVNTTLYTVKFEQPYLANGVGIYSRGYYTDVLIRDWKPLMYLWGLTLTVLEYEGSILEDKPCGDLIELSVVDKDDLFKMDVVTQALFGVNAVDATPYLTAMGFEDNGEYGHWTKYYDESWILSCNGVYTPAPDGSPGELLPGLYLRLSFFTTENEEHDYHIFIDYYPTSKS